MTKCKTCGRETEVEMVQCTVCGANICLDCIDECPQCRVEDGFHFCLGEYMNSSSPCLNEHMEEEHSIDEQYDYNKKEEKRIGEINEVSRGHNVKW